MYEFAISLDLCTNRTIYIWLNRNNAKRYASTLFPFNLVFFCFQPRELRFQCHCHSLSMQRLVFNRPTLNVYRSNVPVISSHEKLLKDIGDSIHVFNERAHPIPLRGGDL